MESFSKFASRFEKNLNLNRNMQGRDSSDRLRAEREYERRRLERNQVNIDQIKEVVADSNSDQLDAIQDLFYDERVDREASGKELLRAVDNNQKLLNGDFTNKNLQVGTETDAENQINVTISAMSTSAIGVDTGNISVSDHESAKSTMQAVKDALESVSTQRSDLGAIQNRLEHTIKNLDNVAENTQSAESAIRDTDMATEMVKYSNNNILAQAGQSMLAQANQTNQGVLSLLG